jgi:hypothetical protein
MTSFEGERWRSAVYKLSIPSDGGILTYFHNAQHVVREQPLEQAWTEKLEGAEKASQQHLEQSLLAIV